MYPQTVVPSGDDLHTTLTNGMDVENSGVKLVPGVHYTANKDKTAWNPDDQDPNYSQELNPVYEYQGERYVRATPYAYVKDSDDYKYNVTADNPNPERVDQCAWNDSSSQPDRLRWFKVEPIKWIVLNFNKYKDKINEAIGYQTEIDTLYVPQGATLELYAADVLIGGIQFNPESATQTVWNQSSIYKYLNIDFYNQTFSNSDKLQIQVSTIYNNTNDAGSRFGIDDPVYNLNSNHLQSGGMNPTEQKIYLLSRYELDNTSSPYIENGVFGTNHVGDTSKRQVGGTDYARAHYLRLSSNNVYGYWLRTAYSGTNVYRVSNTGSLASQPTNTSPYGTRPALTMDCFAL